MDGWNEQISQLTAECDQLKDSLQEVTKVLVFTVFVVALSTCKLQTSGKLFNCCLSQFQSGNEGVHLAIDNIVASSEKTNTVEPLVATTSPQRPVFHNTKSFQVKSLYFEPLVSDHLS